MIQGTAEISFYDNMAFCCLLFLATIHYEHMWYIVHTPHMFILVSLFVKDRLFTTFTMLSGYASSDGFILQM